MKTLSRSIIIAVGIFAQTASLQAQTLLSQSLVPTPYSPLKTLTGFQPSVVASEQDALKIYNLMPANIFEPKSLCSQRAEKWSYDLYTQLHLSSMKVMLLFTDRYKREFGYVWDYHIAPLIPVKMMDGSIQDLVFDPTFTRATGTSADSGYYDNKAITMQAWTRYFVYPDAPCMLIDNYDDFLYFQDRAYCYLMKVPMYVYQPDDMPYLTSVPTNFRPGDLKYMKRGLK